MLQALAAQDGHACVERSPAASMRNDLAGGESMVRSRWKRVYGLHS